MLNKKAKIFIAGHKGMVGSSRCEKLKKNGYVLRDICDRSGNDIIAVKM